MLRHALIALLALPLATTALADESLIAGAESDELVTGQFGGVTPIACSGRADDTVVIRNGDGSLYAAGTLAQFAAKGGKLNGPLVVKKVSRLAGESGPIAAGKPGAAEPAMIELVLVIPKTPIKLERGTVEMFRGQKTIDADPIKLR